MAPPRVRVSAGGFRRTAACCPTSAAGGAASGPVGGGGGATRGRRTRPPPRNLEWQHQQPEHGAECPCIGRRSTPPRGGMIGAPALRAHRHRSTAVCDHEAGTTSPPPGSSGSWQRSVTGSRALSSRMPRRTSPFGCDSDVVVISPGRVDDGVPRRPRRMRGTRRRFAAPGGWSF